MHSIRLVILPIIIGIMIFDNRGLINGPTFGGGVYEASLNLIN